MVVVNTLYSPINVGPSNSLELTMIFNPLQIFSFKLVQVILIGFFLGNQCVAVLFHTTFVLRLIFKVSVGSLPEDLGEDPGSLAHIILTMTRQAM